MRAPAGFIFFMLFLAGLAFVNLRGMQNSEDAQVTSTTQIADTAWRPTHLGETRINNDTPMFVQFNADGTLIGHGGCNRFSGAFDIDDGSLIVGPLGSTRMSCPEPINSYEIAFLDSLRESSTALRTETRLALRDGNGTIVSRFDATALQSED